MTAMMTINSCDLEGQGMAVVDSSTPFVGARSGYFVRLITGFEVEVGRQK